MLTLPESLRDAFKEPLGPVTTDADELLAAAKSIDANAICISGRRRRPTGKAVFGSVTQDVILGSDRPVLTVPASTQE
jgi:nucleotide-binding universal stress UspA family protein